MCTHMHVCVFLEETILLPAAFSCRRESACPCSDCLEEKKQTVQRIWSLGMLHGQG